MTLTLASLQVGIHNEICLGMQDLWSTRCNRDPWERRCLLRSTNTFVYSGRGRG